MRPVPQTLTTVRVRRSSVALGIAGFALLGSTIACSDDASSAPACSGAECAVADGGGDAGEGGKGPEAPACDLREKSARKFSCLIDEAYAVFVDGTRGADTNAGTREAPFRTIGKALASLKETQAHVMVCVGTYAERIRIGRPQDGVRLHGGLDCNVWTYTPNGRAIVESADAEDVRTVLEVRDLSTGAFVEDFVFRAKDARAPSRSSVAIVASRATLLELLSVEVFAGKGLAGAAGTDRSDIEGAAPIGSNVGATNAVVNACGGASSTGGAGGVAASGAGQRGLPSITPPFPDATFDGNGGGANADCDSGGRGRNGSFGVGGAGGEGASIVGSVNETGFVPIDGAPGGDGGPGQGGGGGSGRSGFAGSSGGAGGCGGLGGGAGQAGGGSIGVAAWQTQIDVQNTTFTVSEAGNGGAGGRGQKAQAGGLGASGAFGACASGSGGPGGSGGGGGGGAGGTAAAIAWAGDFPPRIEGVRHANAPTLPEATLPTRVATPGSGGAGGAAALTSPVPSRAGASGTGGVPGVTQAVLPL
jgi:hypothetical protein